MGGWNQCILVFQLGLQQSCWLNHPWSWIVDRWCEPLWVALDGFGTSLLSEPSHLQTRIQTSLFITPICYAVLRSGQHDLKNNGHVHENWKLKQNWKSAETTWTYHHHKVPILPGSSRISQDPFDQKSPLPWTISGSPWRCLVSDVLERPRPCGHRSPRATWTKNRSWHRLGITQVFVDASRTKWVHCIPILVVKRLCRNCVHR